MAVDNELIDRLEMPAFSPDTTTSEVSVYPSGVLVTSLTFVVLEPIGVGSVETNTPLTVVPFVIVPGAFGCGELMDDVTFSFKVSGCVKRSSGAAFTLPRSAPVT